MVDVMIRRDDAARGVSAHPGDVLILELEENLSTGYSWHLAPLPDWCRLVDSEHVPARSGLMGAPGLRRFRFSVSGPGSASIEAGFRRPWEAVGTETEAFSVRVTASA